MTGVDASVRAISRTEALLALSRDRDRWRQRYHANTAALGPVVRDAHTAVVRWRLAAALDDTDAIVQVGHWYDLSGCAPTVASYSDGSVALQLRRGDLCFDPAGRAARRAFDWEAAVARRMDLVFAMSQWQAASFTDDYGVDPARIRVIGQGPNVPLPVQPCLRPDPQPTAVFVGKSFSRKGGPELLAAWPLVRAQVPEARLVLVGPRSHPPLPEGVTCVGRIDRTAPGGEASLAAQFAAATVLVLPSRFEPFGTAMLEGMGWGLACVGSRACAMPEVIVDGVTGRLVTPGDRRGLADALIGLLRDPRRAVAMGEAGRRRLHAALLVGQRGRPDARCACGARARGMIPVPAHPPRDRHVAYRGRTVGARGARGRAGRGWAHPQRRRGRHRRRCRPHPPGPARRPRRAGRDPRQPPARRSRARRRDHPGPASRPTPASAHPSHGSQRQRPHRRPSGRDPPCGDRPHATPGERRTPADAAGPTA